MSEVGIRALKQNASQVVARAAAGEAVTITDRGKPVARLVPITESRIDELVADGRLRLPAAAATTLPSVLDEDPVAGGSTTRLSDLVEEHRGDRI